MDFIQKIVIFAVMSEEENREIRGKSPWKVDVAVLILFFNRPGSLSKVFEEVRKARPSRLFLYQDGARGPEDKKGMEACRKIVENVDWECDVRRNYQEKNYGVDPSNYMAQKWAFGLADKCIVFEDDSIPSQTFFSFCKEMLDRYENDERIGMIAGFNTDEETKDTDDSYFFTSVFSIWGWASWKRVVDKWDSGYSWMDDKTESLRVERIVKERGLCRDTLRACKSHRESWRDYYETIFWSSMVLNSQLAIMPRVNMITNLGPLAGDAAHYRSGLEIMPRAQRRLFEMERRELEFPLRHPKNVIEHLTYKDRNFRQAAYGHPWIKAARSLEELYLNIRHGKWGNIVKALSRRISKWRGTFRHT